MNKKEEKFCSYCEHRGMITNPEAHKDGSNPLIVCPKCVEAACKCGGNEPYYYTDGKEIIECPCRSVRMRIDRVHYLYDDAGIDRKYRWHFINEFNCRTEKEHAAKRAAYDIIMNYPDVSKGLFLWGNPGTGKTFLSTIILTELIARKAVKGKFVKISRTFFGRIRNTFSDKSEDFGMGYKIEQELAECELLVIDDFGVQRDSAWEQETLYNLIDARYEAERLTIITSNSNPEKGLKELSEGRILSRLKEMTNIIELSGTDRREAL